MRPVDEKLRFAVFIDFDNIEIGVKSTLHREFDVECVLEGIKERGEIAAKVAYGNWSRQSQATRAFTEHGVHMVQRDSTPRGDKNGADINLALDALEMAFTREHINAFAIISGDSDFMALVNKLKQFNKRVYIVGGKAFTSTILQRNCHEFISYESLLDSQPSQSRRGGQQGQRGRQRRSLPLSHCLPLLERALGALELRGVQPQMGLLKSTMLQLDPAFTERDYGTSSFSSFVEKLVGQGLVSLRSVDGRSVVERKGEPADLEAESSLGPEDALPFLKEVLEANVDLLAMGIPAREVRALAKAADAEFRESDYGFQQFTELLNFAADKGLIRVEADVNHGLRFYPGDDLNKASETPPVAGEEAPTKASSGPPAAAAQEPSERPVRSGRSRSRSRSRRKQVRRGDEQAGTQRPAAAGTGANGSPGAVAVVTPAAASEKTSEGAAAEPEAGAEPAKEAVDTATAGEPKPGAESAGDVKPKRVAARRRRPAGTAAQAPKKSGSTTRRKT